jgi:hypothetical protein
VSRGVEAIVGLLLGASVTTVTSNTWIVSPPRPSLMRT